MKSNVILMRERNYRGHGKTDPIKARQRELAGPRIKTKAPVYTLADYHARCAPKPVKLPKGTKVIDRTAVVYRLHPDLQKVAK